MQQAVTDKTHPVDLILASASPRRRELLAQIGIAFRVVVADVDETVRTGETPAQYVVRLAQAKALEVLQREKPGLPVLGSDTAVVLGNEILGKPRDRDEAREMLNFLSGKTHEVYSAVAVAISKNELYDRLNVTRVTFAQLEPEWIESYCDTRDSMDKAGAYGVQGRAAERISRIEGSFSGVMGLPLFETSQLLETVKCYARSVSVSVDGS
jgi:septum formation protein